MSRLVVSDVRLDVEAGVGYAEVALVDTEVTPLVEAVGCVEVVVLDDALRGPTGARGRAGT